MASEFVAGRREELERTAAKYTDKPAECVTALRGDILTDIAEGLALIGVGGGLIDILEYAAELAYAELPETPETDLSLKRGIMSAPKHRADSVGETLADWWAAFATVAALVFTVGYVDHLAPDSHCQHCARRR